MYLADCHTHTCCSPDSTARLSDMAEAAHTAGLQALCTTDHCDLQNEDGSQLKSWDWSPILAQFDEAEFFQDWPDFRLHLGIELGGAYTDPSLAEQILSGAPLDFVIGSVHNQSPQAGGRALFYLDFQSEDLCRRTLDDYFSCLLVQAALPYYDALGHIIYPLRYINGRSGHHFTLEPWQGQLDQVLTTVVQTGRAIELNTHGGREVQEWLPVLKRYRELGGELLTVGSDAHTPGHVGKGLGQALELLRETGFRWLTLYRRRKPEQIKL